MELKISAEHGFKLYNNLHTLSPEKGYYAEHLIRHPADILRLQFDKLVAAQKQFLQSVKKSPIDDSKSHDINSYILSLDSFYDNLLLIIKATSAPTEYKNNDAAIWLKTTKSKAYAELGDSVSKQHSLIRKLSNKIKHASVDLHYIEITDHQGMKVDGFYLSNLVDGHDLNGPDPDIHKRYHGASTAISYNYFTSFAAGFVASCLFHLNRILFKTPPSEKVALPSTNSFFREAMRAETRFFPNEYGLEVSEITDKNEILTVKFPRKVTPDAKYDQIQAVSPTLKMNQRTNSNKAEWPYFKLLDLNSQSA